MSAFLYKENPELKVYVEDALRLVLAARPEKPLDLINDYLQRYSKHYLFTSSALSRCRLGSAAAAAAEALPLAAAAVGVVEELPLKQHWRLSICTS